MAPEVIEAPEWRSEVAVPKGSCSYSVKPDFHIGRDRVPDPEFEALLKEEAELKASLERKFDGAVDAAIDAIIIGGGHVSRDGLKGYVNQAARVFTPPERRVTDPVTGGQKGTKPERYDLLPYEALDEVARVYGFGAQKYEANNWRKGYAWSLSYAAAMRHMSQFWQGQDDDVESGLHHLAHAAFHMLSLITFLERDLGTDDRPCNTQPEC